MKKSNERNRGNRFWQPTSSFNPNLPGDRHFTPIGIIEELKFFENYWGAENHTPTTDVSA